MFPMSVLRDEDGVELETQTKRLDCLNKGYKGVFTVLPFQCETCWMRNLENRNPSALDKKYVQCIRRANLGAMAGRARSTVEAHVGRIVETIKYCRGPFPLDDMVGMSWAVDMLMKSLEAKG
jgi:hypothetical protein